ncbi:uncharacterized protein LOC117783607 [Drosophila innubila]|uniref:uncharacterized protein LOC117783607 n=1 Tax=Drosophila innubila TaxID=198719 RepID=UPI00148D5CDF|nr:uncharacterized protein LOC117783607 [Drosophila innubila]
MAEAGFNSCCRWKAILSKSLPQKCNPNCFEPLNGKCPDYKIIDVVKLTENPEESHVAFQEPVAEAPFRRIIDTKALCARCCEEPDAETKRCKLWDAQNSSHRNNLCSAECRPLSTSLHLKECTKRPRPKPTYKHCVFMDHETLAGRVFPVKLRIRREKNHCLDCNKELYFRDPITDNSNVVVLTNCCDVKVYSNKYIENWHRVPILSLTGKEVMKKRTINEVCKLEPKKEPIKVVEDIKPVEIAPPPKKGKGGKGKKGKK